MYKRQQLAQAEQSEVVAAAYAGQPLAFGPEYLIPKPFDPRPMMKIAPAVAQAEMDSGVAVSYTHLEVYKRQSHDNGHRGNKKFKTDRGEN